MKNDLDTIINDLLVRWHCWACRYQYVGGINSSPMFRDAKTSKGWDSITDIVDSEIDHGTMAAVNFHVMELPPIYRTVLQIQARNLHTGVSVWSSPRLPQDPEERTIVVIEGRNQLAKKLFASGVI